MLVPDNAVAVARAWPRAESFDAVASTGMAAALSELRLVITDLDVGPERRFQPRGVADRTQWVDFDPTAHRPERGAVPRRGVVVPLPDRSSEGRGRKRRMVGVVLIAVMVALAGVALSVVASHAAVVAPSAASGQMPLTTEVSTAGHSALSPHAPRSRRPRDQAQRAAGDRLGGAGGGRVRGPSRPAGRTRAALLAGSTGTLVPRGSGTSPVACGGGTARSIAACARRQEEVARRSARQAKVRARHSERTAIQL